MADKTKKMETVVKADVIPNGDGDATTKKPTDILKKVSPGIWFVQGDEQNRPKDSTDPHVILLFGWMEAKPAHLAKFSAAYKLMFPYTNQIVVGADADVFVLPNFILRNRLRPVVELLRSLDMLKPTPSVPPKRVLIHTLSNGGICQLITLSQILPRSAFPSPNSPSPFSTAFIIDSAPGGDDFGSVTYVFKQSFPNPFIRYPFFVVLFLVHLIGVLFRRVTFHYHETTRRTVLQDGWLPWVYTKRASSNNKQETPFLYIYSKTDRAVPYPHVHAHTQSVEAQGRDITREVFETSAHVGHMRSDPERYWNAVRKHWQKAVDRSR